jgi:CheY-like chemotaxis protein
MPVILVLDDDSTARDALVDTLRRLFARARIVAARGDLEPALVARERADVVLASLAVAERLCRRGAPLGGPVVALTREMSPDTLLKAESLGLAGVLRAPASPGQLATALGPMLAAVSPRDLR